MATATQSLLYRAPFGPGGASAIDAALAEKLLAVALARGGDYADLFFEYRAAGGLVFDEGILKNASRGVSMGLGVRVQKGDATGYAYVERLDWDAMRRAADTAAQIASGGGAKAPVVAQSAELPRRYELETVTLDVPGIEKRKLLERAAAAAHAADARVVKVEASLSEEVREILVVTSDGTMARDTQPLVRFGVRVIAEKDGKRQEGSSGGGGRTSLGYFEGKSPEWHAREAARQAVTMLDAQEAPAGQMEVVLAPGDSGILLHEAVGHGLEADFNRKGTSNYAGKMGEPVASEVCTVVDDATLLQSRGTINVDDEGNEPHSSVLIEKGRLVGYMHDRLSAKHYKLRPSGNGRRESFACAPMPRMTNTILLAGENDPEEILKTVKRGIYAKRFGGGQVDIANGDFVFSLTESYLVEDGKLTAPLKGVNLIGNGPDVLRRVTMLGNDVEVSDGIWTCGKDGQSVPVGVGCPTIKIASITVGGTKVA
jgi:TldD protein